MLIALTLLDNHFDAILLELKQGAWKIMDHDFLPTASLPQLYKKWHQHTRHIAIGLNRHYCHYHQFNINQHIADHELNKYIALNAKQFFEHDSKQLIFNFERHNLNSEFDQIHCIASIKISIHHIIKRFQKIGFKIQLIDSSVNALIRGFLQQQKPDQPHFAIFEEHQNGHHTLTHDIDRLDNTIDKIYCVNTTRNSHITTKNITHQPGSLTTYGLSLNAHLNQH